MDERDKLWMRERYSARLRQYGDDIRTLGSGTEERRRIRFGVLQDVGIESGATVLDVGCGFGDFYGFLATQGVDVHYIGMDINPELLDVARAKYPAATFVEGDFETHDVAEVDFVVASGTFNLALRAGDNYPYVERILRRAFARARRGVAMDFQTNDVDFRVADMHYYEPERVFRMAKSMTKRVTLRHDYPLYEFCIYLFPDFRGWRADEKDRTS